MTDREDRIRRAMVKGTPGPGGSTILDRTQPFRGACEACGDKKDLRPYSRGGKWVCFACAVKDPEAMDARAAHVLFGEPLPDDV